MADIDIDPFGGPQGPRSRGYNRTESKTEEPTDEHIPFPSFTPVGGSTWEPKREQEMSF